MSEVLRECPFCGKPAKWEKKFLMGGIARCSDSQCIGAFTHLSRSASSGEWNTRPVEDAKDKEIDSLVLCLAKIKLFCKEQHDYYTEREKTDIPELKPLDKYMIDWCDYIIETINSTCSGKGTNDGSDRDR